MIWIKSFRQPGIQPNKTSSPELWTWCLYSLKCCWKDWRKLWSWKRFGSAKENYSLCSILTVWWFSLTKHTMHSKSYMCSSPIDRQYSNPSPKSWRWVCRAKTNQKWCQWCRKSLHSNRPMECLWKLLFSFRKWDWALRVVHFVHK